MFKPKIVVLSLILAATLVAFADAREWTDTRGRTYDGVFSGLVDGVVEIDSNGRIIRIPLNELSAADQAYVREQVGDSNSNAQGGGNAGGGASNSGNNQNNRNQGSANQGGGQSGGAAQPGVPNLNERSWTDNNGQRINGRFGGLVDQDTVAIVGGNQRYEVPLANLSQADQDYVAEIVKLFDPRVHGRTWTPVAGSPFQGSYVQIKNTEVWILTSFNDDRLEIEAIELSAQDLSHICDLLNATISTAPRIPEAVFRVWTAADSTWRVIGRLKDVNDREVLLEQEHDDIAIPLASLTSADQTLAREQIPDADDEDEDGTEEDGGLGNREFEDSGFDWSRYYSMHPIFYIILAISILGLISVIAFKYISESFQDDDDEIQR